MTNDNFKLPHLRLFVPVVLACLLMCGTSAAQQGEGRSYNEGRLQNEQIERQQNDTEAQSRAAEWSGRRASQQAARKMTDAQRKRLEEIAYIYADLMKSLPKEAVLLNAPYPLWYSVIGRSKVTFDMDSDIAGGIAMKLNVKRAMKRVDKRGVTTQTIAAINAGDVMCFTFWARSAANSESARIGALGVKKTGNENGQELLLDTVDLNANWQQFAYRFISEQSIEKDKAEVFFHIGNLKQALELGPSLLFNLGPVGLDKATGRACSA